MVDPNESEYELVDWYYIANFSYFKFIIIKLAFLFYFKKLFRWNKNLIIQKKFNYKQNLFYLNEIIKSKLNLKMNIFKKIPTFLRTNIKK